jgi:protease-4
MPFRASPKTPSPRPRKEPGGVTRIVLFVLKSIVGVLATVGLAVVVLVLVGLFAWRDLAETFGGPEMEQAALPSAMVLEIDLAPGVVERRQGGFPPSFDGPWPLPQLVQAIEDAAEDPAVDGLLVRLGAGELNMAQVQELRAAFRAFRESDKFALGFAETFGEAGDATLHYYLSTALDEIWLQPTGDLGLKGFLLEQPYLQETLSDIGIRGSFGQREEYKGAVDPLTRDSMRPAVRENLGRLLDSWADQIAGAIAERKGTELAEARRDIDEGPYLAAAAEERGLVDRLGYLDEFYAYGTRFSERVELERYLGQRELPEPAADAPRIALVYGLGPVVLGHEGEGGPFGGEATMSSGNVIAALNEAKDDPEVEAVVFRVDSPGGSAVASDAIWRAVTQVRKAGKPVVVSMAGVAASGGYYVAAGADRIVALPGTVTGSIGVVTGKFVLTGLWRDLEVNWDGVQAGDNAGFWSPNRPFDAEQWQHLQTSLDSIYGEFLNVVAEGRGMEVSAVREVAGGRVWSGADAAQAGLVDELGGLKAAVDAAKELAGIDPETDAMVVEYPKLPPFQRFLRDLAGLQADAETLVRLAQVVNRLEPILRMLGAFEAAQEQGPRMRVDPALER